MASVGTQSKQREHKRLVLTSGSPSLLSEVSVTEAEPKTPEGEKE